MKKGIRTNRQRSERGTVRNTELRRGIGVSTETGRTNCQTLEFGCSEHIERSERSEGVAKNLDPFHVAKDGLT